MNGADSQAYSSMFVEFSAAKGTTGDYYKGALREIQMMKVRRRKGFQKVLKNTLSTPLPTLFALLPESNR